VKSAYSPAAGLFRVRATKPGRVIELDRQHMLALMQSDAEIGQILMSAFILRRVKLVAETQPDRLPCSWETTKRVRMLVRSASLVENMSRYLIRRIEETPAIAFRPHTEIMALEGGDHLEPVRWRNSQMGRRRSTRLGICFLCPAPIRIPIG
jgi:hypothetical protein